MGEATHIQWADDTYNPWRGCRPVSDGCVHCYIVLTPPFRISGQKHGRERVRASEATLKAPLRWNKKPWVCNVCGKPFALIEEHGCHKSHQPHKSHLSRLDAPTPIFHRRRVFCLSLGDWLDDEVSIKWLADLLTVIRETPNLDWLLLTKRPANWAHRIQLARQISPPPQLQWVCDWMDGHPPLNVWLGVSVENQKTADERIPILLSIPARVRFLSIEPMLEKIDLKLTKPMPITCGEFGDEGEYYEANRGIHWAIFGGESGPRARPCHVDWIRKGVQQCQEAGIAVFVKQLGSTHRNLPTYCGDGSGMKLRDKKGGDPSEWPEYLRVREFPK